MYYPNHQEYYVAKFKEPHFCFKGIRSELQLRKIEKEIHEYEKAAKIIKERLDLLHKEKNNCVKFRLTQL